MLILIIYETGLMRTLRFVCILFLLRILIREVSPYCVMNMRKRINNKKQIIYKYRIMVILGILI